MVMRTLLVLCFTIFTQTVFAQTANYYAKFKGALSKSNTTSMLATLKAWQKQTTKEPEFYVAFTNYYFLKSKQEVLNMSTVQSGSKSIILTDPKSGKTSGYINDDISYNPVYVEKALAYIDSGVASYPNRLDLRFGKVYVYGQTRQFNQFAQEVIKAIDYSNINHNNWLWSENKPPSKYPLNFMLLTVQDYVRELFNAGDEQMNNIKLIAEAVLKYYPNHVPSLSNLAITQILAQNYDAALPPLLQAEKLNPKDCVVLNNIGYCYELKKDKQNAIKYYKLITTYGDENAKVNAASRLKRLQQ